MLKGKRRQPQNLSNLSVVQYSGGVRIFDNRVQNIKSMKTQYLLYT